MQMTVSKINSGRSNCKVPKEIQQHNRNRQVSESQPSNNTAIEVIIMNKFIPMVLSVALLGGSMAMAAPASHVSKTNRTTACKKLVKKVPSKKAGKTIISKK